MAKSIELGKGGHSDAVKAVEKRYPNISKLLEGMLDERTDDSRTDLGVMRLDTAYIPYGMFHSGVEERTLLDIDDRGNKIMPAFRPGDVWLYAITDFGETSGSNNAKTLLEDFVKSRSLVRGTNIFFAAEEDRTLDEFILHRDQGFTKDLSWTSGGKSAGVARTRYNLYVKTV